MKKLSILVLFLFLSFIIISCNKATDPENVRTQNNQQSAIVDYGNGVYYFDSVEADFANALSTFISQHPELQLQAMCGNGRSPNGRDLGYFVVFHKK